MKHENTNKNELLKTIIFCTALIGTILSTAYFLPPYILNNPPICEKEALVKEILGVESGKVKLKLADGQVISQSPKNYNSKEGKFRRNINPNDMICISYKNPIDYYLSYMFVK